MVSVFRLLNHSCNLPAYCFLFIFARNEKSMDKKNEIIVKDVAIRTMSKGGIDYICITDIARQKNWMGPNGVIANWMRNRNTIEFLGIWETLYNPDFNPLEFEGVRQQAGLNAFTLSHRWKPAMKDGKPVPPGFRLRRHPSPPAAGRSKAPTKNRVQASLTRFFVATLRRRRDSNPRYVAVQQFSRLPPSTTRPHLQKDCKDNKKNYSFEKNFQ